jgi:hypothetical protein
MSTVGARVGRSNKIVAAFDGEDFGTGGTGFGVGKNGFSSWLPSDVDVFSSAGDIRRYVARQDDAVVAGGEANSGLTFEPDNTAPFVGPRKTSVGPQLVLVFNYRSL